MYETGGMRRLHLRGRENILKRLLVHAAGFNLGLVMRKRFGVGKPRQARSLVSLIFAALTALRVLFGRLWDLGLPAFSLTIQKSFSVVLWSVVENWTTATGC